jgi:hypothetical protein
LKPWNFGTLLFVASLSFAHHDALAQTAGAAAPPAASPAQVATATNWQVRIETSGGFTGRGAGNVAVLSDGAVQTSGLRACTDKLTSVRVETLSRAVAAAAPASWNPSYVRASNPQGCCDQYHYVLTIEAPNTDGRPTKYTTRWYSEMLSALPVDLRAIYDAAWAIKTDAESKCKAG